MFRFARSPATTTVTVLAVVVMLSSPALTQGDGAGETMPVMATEWSGDASAQTRLVLAEASTYGGGPVWAGIEFKLAPGYVTYWRSPGEGGIPPRFDWGGSENLALSSVRWPVPERVTIGGHELNVYRNHVVLPVRLFPSVPDHDMQVVLKLNYATCAEVCRPVFAQHVLKIPAAAPASSIGVEDFADLINSFLDLVPATVSDEFTVLVDREETGDGGHQLRIVIRTDHPLDAPELFVEGPAALWLGVPQPDGSGDGPGQHSFVLALPGTNGGAIAGGSITITIVAGDFLVETSEGLEGDEMPDRIKRPNEEVPEPPEPTQPN